MSNNFSIIGIVYLSSLLLKSLNEKYLFAGKSQNKRIRQILHRTLATDNEIKILESFGLNQDDIGCRSIGKGAYSYVVGGTTASPSLSSAYLRAGWAMNTIYDTYLRFKSSGDMYLGRCVVGLPVHDIQFATWPPNFISKSKLVAEVVTMCYGTLPKSFLRISEFILASHVYHSQFCFDNFPVTHPIFCTILFKNTMFIDLLK